MKFAQIAPNKIFRLYLPITNHKKTYPMNKRIIFFSLITLFFHSCMPPADYCDTLVSEAGKCRVCIHKVLKNNTKELHNEAEKQLLASEKKIQSLGNFRDEHELYDVALKLIKFYKQTLENIKEGDNLSEFKASEQNLLSDLDLARQKFIKKFDLIPSQL